MQNETSATRRIMKQYNIEVGVAMAFYSGLLVTVLVLGEGRSTPVKAVMALVPVVPLVFVMFSAVRAYRKLDEFMQRTLTESAAIGFAASVVAAAAVGMLGVMIDLPGVAAFFVLALGMTAYMVASAVLMRSRA